MMRGSAVIFDTNAYRNLVYKWGADDLMSKIDELALKEGRVDVMPVASPWVLMELYAKLAASSSAAYSNCRDAVRSIWRHCAVMHPEAGVPVLATAADSEEQLAKTVFGVDLPGHRTTTSLLTSACNEIYEAGAAGSLEILQLLFEEMKRHVGEVKRDFVSDLFKYVVKGFNEEASDWNPLEDKPELRAAVLEFANSPQALNRVAEAIVLKAAMLSNSQIDTKADEGERLRELIEGVKEHFGVPIQHYNDILRRIAHTGSDYTKKNRANDIWDHQLTFLIGPYHSISGRPVVLVTDDGGIKEAARKASVPDLVRSLDEYLVAL